MFLFRLENLVILAETHLYIFCSFIMLTKLNEDADGNKSIH